MSLTRRDFLKFLIVGGGLAALSGGAVREAQRARPIWQAALPSPAAEAAAPELLPEAGAPAAEAASTAFAGATAALAGATAGRAQPPALLPRSKATPDLQSAPAAALPASPATTARAAGPLAGRRLWSWLRMSRDGQVPSSEADYTAHAQVIDVALPLNGGKLQADGTWLQEARKTQARWPQALRQQAAAAGQLYMPGMGNDADGLLALLDNTAVHARAVEGLLALAASRFDTPWDGVYLDLEAIPEEYRARLTVFLARLGRGIKDAGLRLGISLGATTVDDRPVTDPAFDLGLVRELADYVDVRGYDYWGPGLRSIAPYWWLDGVVRYALAGGLSAQKMTLGQATYSRYWSQGDRGAGDEMTYTEALALVQQNGATLEWLEANDLGLVRERIARIGGGHLIVHDGDTYRHGLNLANKYRLLGSTLFVPGMGDDRHWQVIGGWRSIS